MLTHHRRTVSLLFSSPDLPICAELETVATLYQKDSQQFHLVLAESPVGDREHLFGNSNLLTVAQVTAPRLLWLELSPSRVTMTMQGNGQFSYRHFWERGVYGISRYWLQGELAEQHGQLCMRNYTRQLSVDGSPLPSFIYVEYELWSQNLQLGRYELQLEIHH